MITETINLEQAAALMYAETDKIMQLARTGELPGVKIGKSWCFMRSDVIKFLREKIDAATKDRREESHKQAVGIIVVKQPHGRSRPRPVLPDLPRQLPHHFS
jgi:excisionase family DNA binding protein